MSKKGRILYYQLKEKGNQINFIWSDGKKVFVAEVRRLPFEEGFLNFLKAQKDAKIISAELDVHEFADHLNIAYKHKPH